MDDPRVREAAVVCERFPALHPLSFLRLRRADRLIVVAAHNHLVRRDKAAEAKRQQEEG